MADEKTQNVEAEKKDPPKDKKEDDAKDDDLVSKGNLGGWNKTKIFDLNEVVLLEYSLELAWATMTMLNFAWMSTVYWLSSWCDELYQKLADDRFFAAIWTVSASDGWRNYSNNSFPDPQWALFVFLFILTAVRNLFG